MRPTGKEKLRGIGVQENLLDRIIRAIDPVRGARRYQARMMLAVAGGLASSLQWDLPLGPAIVVAAAGMFAVTTILTATRQPR